MWIWLHELLTHPICFTAQGRRECHRLEVLRAQHVQASRRLQESVERLEHTMQEITQGGEAPHP